MPVVKQKIDSKATFGGIAVNVEITGNMAAALRDMGKRLSREVMTEAITKAGAIVLAEVYRRIPVDTGKLRDSLAMEVAAKGTTVSAEIGFDSKGMASIAYWLEHGHNSREAQTLFQKFALRRGKLQGHVPAHPFFRPGVDSSLDAAARKFFACIQDSISKQQASSDDSAASTGSGNPLAQSEAA